MEVIKLCSFVGLLMMHWSAIASTPGHPIDPLNSLKMESPGAYELKILSSNLLELTLITTKEPDPAPVLDWDFVSIEGNLNFPDASEFEVTVNDRLVPVQVISFKRRPLYAPLVLRDLRIANALYLQLSESIADGETVRVANPTETLWPLETQFVAVKDPFRRSPALHVNQAGYAPGLPKKAMAGYFLGSAGEMPISSTHFSIVNTATREVVFQGLLMLRPDVGYLNLPPPYQKVLEADFSALQIAGEYFLQVPDLGVSFPFRIDAGALPVFARTYALGLYHQRCGAANSAPFTHHTHGPCHTGLVEVPNMSFANVNSTLARSTSDYASNPRHTAPRLQDVNASLYPFINTNRIDVSGGHHDAGDYSKYTINSAQLIHALIFAVDTFPGVAQLDNLGLPESGDGISDVLQIAKWEADFLAKMQDADGGFYFLVYPRDRPYEGDVLPDRGDPQVVFPKTTSATAAAVAALAQTASSPVFRHHFPMEAKLYLEKAIRGLRLLLRAETWHGRDGAYQQLTHYGDFFMHDDETVWALTEVFLATGREEFHEEILARFDPADPNTRVWSWWRLFEGYGCAARSYAFAARTGRLSASQLDPVFLAKCEAEILASANDQLSYSQKNAYGFSLPIPYKVFEDASWFFPVNQAFDLTVGYQLDPKPAYLDAILRNLNYEAGCNPVNVSFLTGIGRKRQREIVHQYAQNDRRVLPPGGIPIGALQTGFSYLENYKTELTALTFPFDGVESGSYAHYDRWSDTFNSTTEFVVPQQARGLATTAFLWANFGSPQQPWQSGEGEIANVPATVETGENIAVRFFSSEIDITYALITWEARDQEPFLGPLFTFAAVTPGPQWIEAEALLPDGRRIFAATNFSATFAANLPPNSYQSNALDFTADMVALYHLDFDPTNTNQTSPLTLIGNTRFDMANLGWMAERSGTALRFDDVGDVAIMNILNTALFDSSTESIVLEAMIYVAAYKPAATNVPLISLVQTWNASLEFQQNYYDGLKFRGGVQFGFHGPPVAGALPKNQWHHLRLAIGKTGYSVRINGQLLTFFPVNELRNWNLGQSVSKLILGNFEGWIDEVVVRNVKTRNTVALEVHPGAIGKLRLRLSGTAGADYLLQSSTNLNQWTGTSTNVLRSVPDELLLNTEGERCFFRVLAIP